MSLVRVGAGAGVRAGAGRHGPRTASTCYRSGRSPTTWTPGRETSPAAHVASAPPRPPHTHRSQNTPPLPQRLQHPQSKYHQVCCQFRCRWRLPDPQSGFGGPFTSQGVFLTIILFPFGFIYHIAFRKQRCPNCGANFKGTNTPGFPTARFF